VTDRRADLVVAGGRPPALFPAEPVDVVIAEGAIVAVGPGAGEGIEARETIDAQGGLIGPAFVEAHWHPDKFESWREPDAIGVAGAERATALRSTYRVDDVAERAERGMRLLLAQGVTRARVTVDVDPDVGLKGLEGTLAAREAIGELLDVEIVAMPSATGPADPATGELLREAFALGSDVVGVYPNGAPTTEAGLADLDVAFELAERLGTPLDVHVDEYPDPEQRMLAPLAERVLERGWGDRVLVDHCVALEAYPDDEAAQVVDLVAASGMSVCVMPNNLFGDRPFRGLSRLAELLGAGVNVCAGTDNVNDGYFPFGNLDPIERAMLTFVGGALERDEDVARAWDMVGAAAARAIGAPSGALQAGAPADLVVLPESPDIVQAMRRLPGRRITVRRGRVVGGVDARTWTA
jgi:cytosine deaminase